MVSYVINELIHCIEKVSLERLELVEYAFEFSQIAFGAIRSMAKMRFK